MVEFLHKNNKKMIIEKASNKELELLQDANFKHPENIRASLYHDAITHILKRHGVNSVNVRNGEIPITYDDIANYRNIVNNADAIIRTIDKHDKEAIAAFKQINRYAVVVEQAINKKNELVLKTMYKSNGSYKNNDAYKEFSSTSLNANAKVHHRLSSYSGATENTTKKPLTSQEDLLKTQENAINTQENALNSQDLSPLEQANAEKLAKLESERLESEKEFLKAKEQEATRKAALKRKLEHERGNAGNIESATKIEVGEDIPVQALAQIPKSRVRLNEREIYDLDYAIVKAKDLKPSFTTGGTQKRTDMNEEQIKSIAENFDPKKIFGSGGFEDLPIVLNDGQVIAGNHRIQGMLNFTPKSRYIYERAIKEYYHIDLKPDELLVRMPTKRLNNTEINNLAAFSNQGRFNSESDHAIAVLSHYEAKLKELDKKLDADSIYSLKNIVAKNLNFDKATHPNVTDSNLSLLMFNMPRTKTQGIELLNRWQKEFSNDIKSYEKVKKMFVDNAGSFHNLIHDMSFPNVSLNAYLSDIMDRSFANLKNYPSTSESLKDLSEKFYKMNSLEMFEKSDQKMSDISEILGASVARFARFDDPSKALFEALKSDNIKKGLKEFKIADVTKDMFDPNSKEFKDIDIYDFTHYLLMANREPSENNTYLNRLIQAVKDMQKEKEKVKTPSEWGNNYSEFKGDGLGAINKLLETKKGFVAGAFYKEGLGDIDLVWGNKDYGLEHILKRREKQAQNQGLNEQQAKEYALNIVKSIPEVLEKGSKGTDHLGRVFVDYGNKRVGLNDKWDNQKLENKWVISSYEIYNSENEPPSLLMAQLQGVGLGTPKLTESNPTTNVLKTQEPKSPLELAKAEKLAKLETEKRIKKDYSDTHLSNIEIKKLIDESPNNGKDIIVIGEGNLTPEIVEYIHKKHAKVGIERLDEDEVTAFNFTYPKNAKAIIDYQGIQHALNKHGINSPSVKFSKQPPITYKDIANYRDIVKNADETIKRDNRIISYKQVNSHFVVVEQINRNKSEFIFKTMFKEKGDYKNAPDYKNNIEEND
ncbi:ftsH protease regulator HflK [Helicobacter pylori]|nr:ftsH protease regulator HflK [Helicobacter pylori]